MVEHAAEILVHEEDVAEEQHEGAVDRPLELADRVRDAERRPLIDVLDLDAELAAVAERAHDLEAEVADDDDDAPHADVAQALDLVLQQRLAERSAGSASGSRSLNGLDARALAGGEDHAEHAVRRRALMARR